MIAVGVAAALLFQIGAFFAGHAPAGWAGDALMLASAAAFASACLALHGLAVDAPLEVAIGASVQGTVTLLLLAWWVGSDFWGDSAHADTSTLPLLAVLLFDAVVLV